MKKPSKAKVTKKSPTKKVVKATDRFKAADFIRKMEKTYRTKLPAIYKTFLTDELYVKYPEVEMTGFIRGPYFLDFIDPDLTNTKELGLNSGIHDMDDCNWSEDYVGYAPLASMSHPKLKEGAKGFLVMKVADPALPVLLFDYEGWTLYPLAASFGEFLKNLPNAKNDTATSFCPWEEKEDSDDEEDEEAKDYWELQREEIEEGKHKDIWDTSFEKKKTDVPGAIADLVKLTEIYPENLFLLRSIASLYRKVGEVKSVLEYVERGLRLRPDCIFLLMDLANQKIIAKDFAGALEIAKKIEEGLASSEDEERYNLSTMNAIRGLVYFHQGKNAEALKLLLLANKQSFLVSVFFDGFKKVLTGLREA